MNTNTSINLGSIGYYSLSVLDKNGMPVENKTIPQASIDNVITYAGAYSQLISTTATSGMFNQLFAALGTGSIERTRSSSALASEEPGRTAGESSTRTSNEVDNLDGTSTLTLTRTLPFGLGAKVGTYSEVGLYTASTGGVFVAGQLIKDELGSPTTITILADEQLIVTYTLEWTVPTTTTLVGTGSVMDNSSNVYNYEVWAQPYFNQYVVGAENTNTRYFTTSASDLVGFRAANGTTDYGISVATGSGWAGRFSHDGSGTVTATTQPFSYSPTSFTANDIVYLSFYTNSPTGASPDIVDTSIALCAQAVQANSGPALTVKFLDPVTKTSNDSFSIQADLQINI